MNSENGENVPEMFVFIEKEQRQVTTRGGIVFQYFCIHGMAGGSTAENAITIMQSA